MKNFKTLLAVLSLLIALSYSHISFATDSTGVSGWMKLGTGLNFDVNAVTVFNGNIVAGGKFTTAGGNSADHIATWDGQNWSPMGNGFSDTVNALVVYQGDLYAGGDFLFSGATLVNYIAKWNGTEWVPLGSGMNNVVEALIVYNNQLIAGGEFITAGGTQARYIAKWDGTSWSSLGTGLNKDVLAMTIYDGDLVAGGRFSTAGGISVNNIASWDGTTWSAIGTGVNDRIHALGTYGDKLVVGGRFSSAGGNNANYIAQWNGSSWSTIGGGVEDRVFAFTEYDGKLIAGGQFKFTGTGNQLYVNRIASWDGEQWSTLGSGMNSKVKALTVMDTLLIAAGDFTTAGGKIANRIAVWGNVQTTFISGTVTYNHNNLPANDGYVLALRIDLNTMEALVVDSTKIHNNGQYTLSNVPVDSLYILAHPDSTNHFVPTYYPNSIMWENATVVFPGSPLTGIDISVEKIDSSGNDNLNPGLISGNVILNYLPPGLLIGNGLPFKSRSIVYAKIGNEYKGFGISDNNEFYSITSLPPGTYDIYVNRLGYTSSEFSVTLSQGNNYTANVNFTLTPQSNPTNINPTQTTTTPDGFHLKQNYPNPFNPVTQIEFSIPHNSNVKLTVFDLSGREITKLADMFMAAGNYNVTFDGSQLSTGVYFYRLASEGVNEVRKMILIK
jgi:hypothetical protein